MTIFSLPELELKNIIDKLASFVARNGPEFEQMTKQKQKDNPKFSFLFGGEHYNYYKFKGKLIQRLRAVILSLSKHILNKN